MAEFDIILADMDDTLFDYKTAAYHAFRETLSRYGFTYSRELEERYQTINQGLWHRLELGEVTREQLQSERFLKFFASLGKAVDPVKVNEFYMSILAEGNYLLPGAEEFCKKVSAQRPIYFITNGFSVSQHRRLETSAVSPYICGIFVSEELGFQKPRREFFEAVLGALKVTDRKRCIVLGDSLSSDILGANNAEIPCCWFNPQHKNNPGPAVCDFEISSLQEFYPVIGIENTTGDGQKK